MRFQGPDVCEAKGLAVVLCPHDSVPSTPPPFLSLCAANSSLVLAVRTLRVTPMPSCKSCQRRVTLGTFQWLPHFCFEEWPKCRSFLVSTCSQTRGFVCLLLLRV